MQGCKLIVNEDMFKELCDEETYLKYKSYYKKSFVEINRQAKWCPSPGCTFMVEYPSMKQADIIC